MLKLKHPSYFKGHHLQVSVSYSCVTNYLKHSGSKQQGFYLFPALSLTSNVNVSDSMRQEFSKLSAVLLLYAGSAGVI